MARASHMNSWFIPCPTPPWPSRSRAYGIISEKQVTSYLLTWGGNVAIRSQFWAFFRKEIDGPWWHGIRFLMWLSKSFIFVFFVFALDLHETGVIIEHRGPNDILDTTWTGKGSNFIVARSITFTDNWPRWSRGWSLPVSNLQGWQPIPAMMRIQPGMICFAENFVMAGFWKISRQPMKGQCVADGCWEGRRYQVTCLSPFLQSQCWQAWLGGYGWTIGCFFCAARSGQKKANPHTVAQPAGSAGGWKSLFWDVCQGAIIDACYGQKWLTLSGLQDSNFVKPTKHPDWLCSCWRPACKVVKYLLCGFRNL